MVAESNVRRDLMAVQVDQNGCATIVAICRSIKTAVSHQTIHNHSRLGIVPKIKIIYPHQVVVDAYCLMGNEIYD